MPSMLKDPYRYFRIEARELMDQLGQRLLDLERGASGRDGVPGLLRLAHTLKGAARVVRQTGIADTSHRIEDALVPFRDAPEVVPREAIAAVLAGLADIEQRLTEVPGAELATPPAGAGPSSLAAPRAAEAPQRSQRADVAEMDALLTVIARTHAEVDGLRERRRDADAARTLVRRLRAASAATAASAVSASNLAGAAASNLHGVADELHAVVDRLEQGLGASTERLARELRDLQERTERLRLVPVHTLFAKLERSARDVAATLGKDVQFEARGGEVRIDASTSEAIEGALVQLVRNAVAHGLEAPAARQAAGKPRAGRITIDVRRRGRLLLFACADDGAGVDLAAVRRSAQRRGLVDATTALDEAALLRLLLRGGISTSAVVTEESGRGVGLDVAREAAQRLGGELSARTVAGQGTTLELAVPLSLASQEIVLVAAGDQSVGIPQEALRRAMRLEAGEIGRSGQRETVEVDGRAVPYVALGRLLDAAGSAATPRRISALLVEHAGARAVIGVERSKDVASVVLRPLPELAPRWDLAAGVALAVDGTPTLVLDVEALVGAAQRCEALPAARQAVLDPVLVIDDSVTTRMLETSILESAGYTVDAAVSAEEGLERARRRRYALFLVDVEMPGMDGFTFVERTRADPALRDTPAMLVSSRASLADRQRGAAAGAQGYIVKGEFVQDEFLARVRQLVTREGVA